MQRLWLNLGLTAVVLALALVLVFSKHHRDKKHPPLTALQPDAIHQIVLSRPGSPRLELVRQGTQWRITAPVAVDADALEVKGLLDVASAPGDDTIAPSEVKLSELGLQPAQFTLILDATPIEFGSTEPIRYRRYVQVAGRVHLIADPPSPVFTGDWANLVSKNLLPAGASIRSVSVPGWAVSHSADGKSWLATTPGAAQSAASATAFADAWSNARALWNTLSPASNAAGDLVRLTLSDGRVIDFRITQRDPQFNLTRADLGITYVIGRDEENRLLHVAAPPQPSASSAQSGRPSAAH